MALVLIREKVAQYISSHNWMGLYKCSFCGKETVTCSSSVRTGRANSCGCQVRDATIKRNFKHGYSVRGKHAPEYTVWSGMKKRCNNPNDSFYPHYGGRGIKVCSRWNDSFNNFYEDMGPRPTTEHTIERVDVNGNYEPTNCIWLHKREQSKNRRYGNFLTYKGETKRISHWAKEYGINLRTLRGRIYVYGWSLDKALNTPVRKRNKK